MLYFFLVTYYRLDLTNENTVMEFHHHARISATERTRRFFLKKPMYKLSPWPRRIDSALSRLIHEEDPLDLFTVVQTPKEGYFTGKKIGCGTTLAGLWVEFGGSEPVVLTETISPHAELSGTPVPFQRLDMTSSDHELLDRLKLSILPNWAFQWGANHVLPSLEVEIDQKTGLLHVNHCRVRTTEDNTESFELVGFSLNLEIIYTTGDKQ